MKKVLEGSQAVAKAVSLAKVQVISAYPITPQTHIVEILSDYVTTSKMNAKFLRMVILDAFYLSHTYPSMSRPRRKWTASFPLMNRPSFSIRTIPIP